MPLVFRKQTSGEGGVAGRGEYEVVGSQGAVSSASLLGRRFVWQTPLGTHDTNLQLTNQGGKRRLRRVVQSGVQVQKQAAALAMLPESTRTESALAHGRPIILSARYILDIEFNLVSDVGNVATVEPTTFTARSGPVHDNTHSEDIPAADRFARIQRLWAHVDDLPAPVRFAVEHHRAIIQAGQLLGNDAENAVKGVTSSLFRIDAPQYIPDSDPLPALELLAGLRGEVILPTPPEAPPADLDIRRRLVREMRARATRGPEARRFSRAVQQAYRFTCAFCGATAMNVPGRARHGMDAAHILPWGAFDLDVVQNGILLCKRDHWAFDNDVLVLNYASGYYSVALSPDLEPITDETTANALNQAVGQIPTSRLPANKADWPAPQFITRLYTE